MPIDAISSARQGIDRAFAQLDRSARNVADAPDPSSYPDEFVAIDRAKFAVQADTAVIRTSDEMTRALLDVLG